MKHFLLLVLLSFMSLSVFSQDGYNSGFETDGSKKQDLPLPCYVSQKFVLTPNVTWPDAEEIVGVFYLSLDEPSGELQEKLVDISFVQRSILRSSDLGYRSLEEAKRRMSKQNDVPLKLLKQAKKEQVENLKKLQTLGVCKQETIEAL
ncbi:MAG: hypothetical protein CME64_16045 [Halobacteriovoraceae bacterium]|nr:hypothetical protein [Halobacteriovoraceae bacterium]|tara:strand:- start:21772 stop:22215 length:444 start_codon:yes stop_codon:yes gene_type:complete